MFLKITLKDCLDRMQIQFTHLHDDWPKLVKWAKKNDHELVLVSAQRPHCEEPTTEWLQRWGFMFDEISLY